LDPSYIIQAVDRAVTAGELVENNSSWGYKDGACFLGGLITDGGTLSISVPFEAGRTYLLIAAGDDDAVDVDLKVVGRSGWTIAEDRDNSAAAVVEFRPSASGTADVEVTLYRSRENTSYCSLVLLSDRGWALPLDSMTSSLAQVIAAYGVLHQSGGADNVSIDRNVWSLVGAITRGGGTQNVTGLAVPEGTHAYFAATHLNRGDVDLRVRQSASGRLVGEDLRADGFPIVVVDNYGYPVDVSTINAAGQPTAFVSTMIVGWNGPATQGLDRSARQYPVRF
jgi:hypothetical protein